MLMMQMIASYAKMVQATSKILEEPQPAATGLEKMKRVLATWIDNAQLRKMVYDETWGGIITSWAAAAQDNSVDYGNAIFNDHHFHYGMWVYTASIVALMDPTWLTPKNKAWVTSLIRDYANPSSQDPHFPFSRSFDWYHGHSWALGLDVSQDGKNAESSSEDAFSIYAIKLWAQAIGDTAMEARATLQLAIMKRTIGSYFLMQSNNKVFPPEFLGNKVIGIVSTSPRRKPGFMVADGHSSCTRTKPTTELGLAIILNISMASICSLSLLYHPISDRKNSPRKNGAHTSILPASRCKIRRGRAFFMQTRQTSTRRLAMLSFHHQISNRAFSWMVTAGHIISCIAVFLPDTRNTLQEMLKIIAQSKLWF
jgi:hypothetical protein